MANILHPKLMINKVFLRCALSSSQCSSQLYTNYFGANQINRKKEKQMSEGHNLILKMYGQPENAECYCNLIQICNIRSVPKNGVYK